MVDRDPARQAGSLARAAQALGLSGWRRLLLGIYPLVVAGLLALANQAGWFAATDALFYDETTLREPGREPQVVIVSPDPAAVTNRLSEAEGIARAALRGGARRVAFARDPGLDPARAGLPANRIVVARPVERLAGSGQWHALGPPAAPGVIVSAQALAGAERGLHRRQHGWLPAAEGHLPLLEAAASGRLPAERTYLVRLPRDQNLPRIAAEQLVGGEIDSRVLKDKIVLVEPARADFPVATARDPLVRAMPLSEYQALAIQTLADGREVRQLGPLWSALVLLGLAALAGAIFLLSDPKRIIPLMLLTGLAFVLGGGVLTLLYANLLLPVTAMALALPLAALLVLQRAELDEDRNLRRFVTQTINLNSRQVLLTDLGRLPGFLATTAPLLGIARTAVFEDRGGRLDALADPDGLLDAIAADRRKLRTALRRAERAPHPVDGSALLPEWEGTVQLAHLGPGSGRVFWLFAFAPGRASPAALDAASAVASDYLAIQQLRSDLSAGSDKRREYRPADEWAGGAVSLIARQGRQVAGGLDGLETAVMVFHPIGFPIHANVPMAALYETVGLPLADTTLPTLLGALTPLDPDRIASIVSELALHGGEMRVNCRELDTRARQLRVAAAREAGAEGPGTLVVEAVDITEPQRLAQLRLSVSNLLDVNIRNDLEAIGFALAIAQNPATNRQRLERALGQVEKAARRATARLDEMAPHMQAAPEGSLSECYPIDAVSAVREACDVVGPALHEMGVKLELDAPEIAGFTLADPRLLSDMVEAMLRIVIADTPTGEAARITVHEDARRTQITVAGGIGMTFQRLYAALESAEKQAPGPFRTIGRGMAAALGWGAVVSYSSEINRGYRFVIDLRRIA